MHAPYSQRKDDDDFVQAHALVREVMDDEARERLISNVVGHLQKGVTEPVLERAFEYWRKIDPEVGERIEQGVRLRAPRRRAVLGIDRGQAHGGHQALDALGVDHAMAAVPRSASSLRILRLP